MGYIRPARKGQQYTDTNQNTFYSLEVKHLSASPGCQGGKKVSICSNRLSNIELYFAGDMPNVTKNFSLCPRSEPSGRP